jgi:hypothetical protein
MATRNRPDGRTSYNFGKQGLWGMTFVSSPGRLIGSALALHPNIRKPWSKVLYGPTVTDRPAKAPVPLLK